MGNLAAHVRLRPIRFGFLVKPGDGKSLLEVSPHRSERETLDIVCCEVQ